MKKALSGGKGVVSAGWYTQIYNLGVPRSAISLFSAISCLYLVCISSVSRCTSPVSRLYVCLAPCYAVTRSDRGGGKRKREMGRSKRQAKVGR